MRRGVGSRRDRRAGPPSAASALGVSGGGCARSTKHAEKKRGWARVQRGVVARALPVADRRGHAPGGDRKPAALGGRRLVQVKYASCAAIAVRVPVHTSQPGKPDCCAERCPRRQDRARRVLRQSRRQRPAMRDARQQPGRNTSSCKRRDGQQQRQERTRRQKLIRRGFL